MEEQTNNLNFVSGNFKKKTNTQLFQQQIIRKNIDKDCLYYFPNGLIRIEYPGIVKDVSKALETLGGMYGIEMAVSDQRNKLELRFHPDNKYNRPCVADRDSNPGILISVTESINNGNVNLTYDVVGVTSLNFKFNRLSDFQYLPVISADKSEDNAEFIHDKIIPEKLPDFSWFISKESVNQPIFFTPSCYSRFDSSQNKLYLNAGERFTLSSKTGQEDIYKNINKSSTKNRIPLRPLSQFVNFQNPKVEIPDQPLTATMDLIREKVLEEQYKVVKILFENRPVWSKIAIAHKTGFNNDVIKIVLPSLAYFCHAGPWRMCWLRFEYDPTKDYNSRIYQTLDYRIRTSEGTKIKVVAKRCYTRLQLGRSSLAGNLDERNYILKHPYIPPARQMFYQYCDILLPEIQEMLQRLPKLPASAKYNSKNGWLPVNFTEQCREIVNKYVLDSVKRQLHEDSLKKQDQQMEEEAADTRNEETVTYCSKMLSNIRKGIYKSVNVIPMMEGSKSAGGSQSTVDSINLTQNDDDDEVQINLDDVVNSIPENINENYEDEDMSSESDLEFDMEAVEEINRLIAGGSNE